MIRLDISYNETKMKAILHYFFNCVLLIFK